LYGHYIHKLLKRYQERKSWLKTSPRLRREERKSWLKDITQVEKRRENHKTRFSWPASSTSSENEVQSREYWIRKKRKKAQLKRIRVG